jgi:hypothetical protein
MASSARPVIEAAEKAPVPGLRETLWDQQNQKPTYPKLDRDASADVIVVGAVSRASASPTTSSRQGRAS